MALSAADKLKLRNGIMRYISREGITLANTVKADLDDAITDVDDAIDADAVRINNYYPPAAKNNWTTDQKTVFFALVCLMRVSPEFAARVLELD